MVIDTRGFFRIIADKQGDKKYYNAERYKRYGCNSYNKFCANVQSKFQYKSLKIFPLSKTPPPPPTPASSEARRGVRPARYFLD
jgi:hypothetical protein